MIYKVTHTTSYQYAGAVPIGYTRVCLAPRHSASQRCLRSSIEVTPVPSIFSHPTLDYYGNNISFFNVQESHKTLVVTSASEVSIEPQLSPAPEATPPWEAVRDQLATIDTPEHFDAYQFAVDFELDEDVFALREYALPSFTPGRPILAAAIDLMNRIHTEFTYDPTATTITTPIKDVLANRRGVCQDFAHLQIGCLRALGLAARYVSGYIRPLALGTKIENVGAQASHAWLATYVPGHGWVDLDPTNNCLPSEEHITVAWGRDYEDVSPVRGVVIGGGAQRLTVGVIVRDLA